MFRAVDALFLQQLPGGVVHGSADQRTQACAADLDIPMGEVMTKKIFSGGAATNIAHAYGQKPFEHDVLSPVAHAESYEASTIPCNALTKVSTVPQNQGLMKL
ncbi:hypothetical protein GCM10010872_20070 [Dyella flava]|nr:hypothetical protein GCM10010872_20070 [Dyella flava]